MASTSGPTRIGWSTSLTRSVRSRACLTPTRSRRPRLLNGRTGKRALYSLPMGRATNHIHVWTSLLERAGFTLADIPTEWEAFWSFWCDRVQPAVRKAMGRDDIWGAGLPMSVEAGDTHVQVMQFQYAYHAYWTNADGQIAVDDPAIRANLIKALEAYTAVYLTGCTPPDAIDWENRSNNDRFVAQTVVMTLNSSLSIPNAIEASRPDDYRRNTATIEWPNDADDQPLAIFGTLYRGAVFRTERPTALGKDFVRFLVEEGWLAALSRFRGRSFAAADGQASRAALLARRQRSAPYGLGDPDPNAAAALRHGDRSRSGIQGPNLEEGRTPRRCRGLDPGASRGRGDRPHQGACEQIVLGGTAPTTARRPRPSSGARPRGVRALRGAAHQGEVPGFVICPIHGCRITARSFRAKCAIPLLWRDGRAGGARRGKPDRERPRRGEQKRYRPEVGLGGKRDHRNRQDRDHGGGRHQGGDAPAAPGPERQRCLQEEIARDGQEDQIHLVEADLLDGARAGIAGDQLQRRGVVGRQPRRTAARARARRRRERARREGDSAKMDCS